MKMLNHLTDKELKIALFRCCGSTKWVDGMLDQRPFSTRSDLHRKAKQVYAILETADYLEAFSHHPRIGGDLNKLREKFAPTADWSGNEQVSVKQASEEVLQRLAKGNDAYYEKFGYIFIVCATCKNAQEMLDLLEVRLPNDPAEEIKIAAGEQEKIMAIRLDKLLAELAADWLTHSDEEHHFSFRFPEFSSAGQAVTVEKAQKDGTHRIHVFTEADMQEVYFEVRSYASKLDHDVDIEQMNTSLVERSPEGEISPPAPLTFQSLKGTEFRFAGQLQGFYKVRRFMYVDTKDRTYRIIYDPRSETNAQILNSLKIL